MFCRLFFFLFNDYFPRSVWIDRITSSVLVTNIPATYYTCPFISILFSQIFNMQFCRGFFLLERMKTDGANPENLVVRCALFAYALCSSVSGTGPLFFAPTSSKELFLLFQYLITSCKDITFSSITKLKSNRPLSL